MQPAPTILLILLGLSGTLSVYLAAWAQLRSRVPGAREFAFLMAAVAIYTLGYLIEISRDTLPGILEAVRLEYLGLAFIPAGLMLFAARTVTGRPMRGYVVALLLFVPVTTVCLVFTIPYHNLFYVNPQVSYDGFFPALAFDRGPWYLVNFASIEGLTLAAVALLVWHAGRAGAKQRRQAFVLVAGALCPLIGAVLYWFGFIPGKIDPGPISLSLTGLLFAVALFRLGLFELVPAARELALDSIRDSFLVVDRHGCLQDLNQAAWQLPGAAALKVGDALPAENSLVNKLRPLLEAGEARLEFSTDEAQAGARYYTARAYPIWSGRGRQDGTAIVINDITDSVGLLNQLSHQANTDELTGLLNRRHLMRLGALELERTRSAGLPFGVILIDIDHFKRFNDQHGHAVGDEVLRRVAECFRKGSRTIDILGRYGGEEFALFLPGADLKTAGQVAERLWLQLGQGSILAGQESLVVTASFGVHAARAGETLTLDELLRAADIALYQAKGNGRNRVVCSEGSLGQV